LEQSRPEFGQSRPDSGLDFRIRVSGAVNGILSSLESGLRAERGGGQVQKGSRVYSLVVRGLGSEFQFSVFGFRVSAFVFGVWGLGYRVRGLGFGV